jgi:preprotein translocase subunit SecF
VNVVAAILTITYSTIFIAGAIAIWLSKRTVENRRRRRAGAHHNPGEIPAQSRDF